MQAGALNIKLMADIADIQRKMAQMQQLAQATSNSMAQAFGGLGAKIGGALSVGAIVAFVRQTANAIDAMNDLADATGASIEEISKLDQVARRNGATLDQVGGILVKFNSALKEADGKNGASIALQALGLEAAKLRQLDPAEALRQTAVALAGFADDGNKARIIQELFSKSVREAAPFLKDLAEAGTLTAKITKEQAEEAEKFNKQLHLLGANSADAARSLLSDLLPALNDILEKFNRFKANGGVIEGFFTLLKSQYKEARIQATTEEIERLKQLITRPNQSPFWISTYQKELDDLQNELKQLQGESVKAKTSLDKALGRPDAGGGRGFINPAAAAAAPSLLDIAAEQARRKAADEAAAALLKQQEAYDKLRTSIEERTAVGQLELIQGEALTEAQRLQIKINGDYAAGLLKLTPAQKAVIDSKLKDLAATEQQVQAEKDAFKAAKAAADARADARRAEERAIEEFEQRERAAAAASLASVNGRIQSLNEEAAAIDLARSLNISLAEAIELVAIKRLREAQQKVTEGSERWKEIEREIEARRELARLIGSRDVLEANRRAADEAARDWQRVAEQIGDGLTDAIMRGGRSAADYLKNLFRQLVLRPIVQAVVNPIVNAVTGSMGGPGAMGTLGGINSLATLGSAITGSVTGSIANVIGTAGTMFGSSALTAFSAGMKGATLAPGLMGPTTAGAGGAMGAGAQAAAAIPYVAAALAVLNAAGVFRSKRIVGGGLTGTLGAGDIQSYDLQRTGGTLFSGPDYNMVGQRVSAESQAIQTAYEALRTNAANMAEALGLSSDAVKTFTTQLGTDVLHNDLAARGIKLDGLTPEEAAQKVQAALSQANEDLAAFVLGASRTVTETITTSVEDWAEGEQGRWMRGYVDQVSQVTRTIEATGPSFARTGETAVQTLTRLASSISTINPVMELLGLQLFDTSLAGADLASTMADAFGGLEKFTQVTAQYYQEFFSAAERTAHVTAQLTEALGGMGMTLPTTRDAFRDLVEAQDLTTEAGRKNFATLMQLSGSFAAITPVLEEVADAGETVTETLRSAADILNERQGLERQLLQLQGDTTALRALDRAALDASNRALFDQITALEDAQAATAAAAQAAQEAADAERALAAERDRIAQERAGLERQLLQLQGDTTALRALDRAALDASNRALFDQITALEDAQAATAAAAQAAQEAADAERALAAERDRIAQERAGLERQLLQLQGDTAALRALDRAALDASNRALFDQITALQDSQAAAAAAAQAQRDYTAAVEAAQAAVERARSAVASAESGVAAVREQATSAYISAQDRVAAANARIAALNADMANAARDAALRVQELGTSLQEFVRGEFATPSQNFGTLLRRALGGDAQAMQGLPEAARAAIDVSRAAARTTAQAAIERARILSSVAEVAAVAAATALPEGAAAADPMLEATQELAAAQAELASALSVANQIGAPLTREVQDLVAKFTAAQEALTLATADLAAAEKALADIVTNTAGTVTAVDKTTTAVGTLKTAFETAKNTLDVQLKAVADSNLPDDIKTLIADKGKIYQVTIGAVMASTLTDAEKTLLLDSTTTASRAIILASAFKDTLTAEQSKALTMVDETVLKTINAAVSTGTLTADQKTLLAQQSATVTKTVQALVDSSNLTADQKTFLNLITGGTATGATVSISGAVTFDPGNALQSIFNNISKSNALLAKMALAQLGPTATAQQKSTTYGAFRELYTDAQTRAIVETAYGRQTDADWAVLKSLAGFADGGVFTNGIVSQPTLFNMAQMGEAGPEAIMPLSRGADGSLGVNLWGGSTRRDEALVAEIRALRQEVTELRAEARSTAVATNKTARILDRVTPDGNSLQTVAAV